MAWWMAAAALAPTIAGALTPRPDTPDFQMQDLGQREYVEDMLRLAADPQHEIQQLYRDQAMGGLDRRLARQGLAGSSLANQAYSMTSADLANKALENELNRRRMAMGSFMDYKRGEMGLGQQMYNAAADKYKADMEAKQGLIKGIGSAAGLGAGMYSESLNRDAIGNLTDQLRASGGGSQWGVPTTSSGYWGNNPYSGE
jgi:hypothetical protein